MIIRFNGANSGIKQYLENGITKERPYDRDQLDERVILNGDLELVDNIINQIDDSGQKYYHITLAFKEDYIDKKTLLNITQEFNDFFLNAYTDDEIVFYAEAHLPKLKSYHDKKTGDIVERKHHIHVVIPQLNLLSRSKFGFPYEKYQEYVSAFQEYINCKYGLASPKENRREGFNQYSEIFSRYKGDNFNGPNKEVKKYLLDKIVQNKVNTYDEFVTLLKSEFDVRVRNENITDKVSYLNIKNKDMLRGINLKEYVFTREFLDLSFNEKVEFFESKFNKTIKYVDVGLPKPIRDDYLEKLQEWNELTSYSEKYINVGGSRKDRVTFANLTVQGKHEFIKQKQFKFYTKHSEKESDARERIEDYFSRRHRAYIRSIIECTKSPEFSGRSLDESRDKIDSIGRTIKRQVISRRAGNIEQSRRVEGKGISTNSQSFEYIDGRDRPKIKSGVLDQLASEYNEVIYKKFDSLNINKIYKYIAADILLELVARTHGVIPEKYLINKGYDGTDRINCGNNNYSVSDFLTKELNLKYSEADTLLQTALQMQNEIDIEMGHDPHKKPYLFNEYKVWMQSFKSEKENIYNQHKIDIKNRRNEIRQSYKAKIQEVRANKSITYYARDKSIRGFKAALVKELTAFDTAVGHDWGNLRKQYNLELQNAYRTFLAEKALKGDDLALQELRRLRVDFEQYKKSGEIRHVDRYQEYRLDIDYKIDDKTGNIVYSINGNKVLLDVGRRIDILNATNDSKEIALKLAIQKFGTSLYLSGSDEFKKKMIEYALVNGYKLSYKDKFSIEYCNELTKKISDEGRYKQIYLENKSLINTTYIKLLGEEVINQESAFKLGPSHKLLESTVGEIVDFGVGYRNSKKVFYLKIKQESGQIKTIWDNKLKDLDLKTNEYIVLAKVRKENNGKSENFFSLARIDVQGIMDKAKGEYEIYCKDLLAKDENIDLKHEKFSLKNVLVLNFEKTHINIDNSLSETYKLTLYDVKTQKSFIFYNNELPKLKAVHQFQIGDLVNIDVQQPLNRVSESIIDLQIKQNNWLNKTNQYFKDNYINIDKNKTPDFHNLSSTIINSELLLNSIKDIVAKHSLDSGDKISLNLCVKGDGSELECALSDIQYNKTKQNIHNDLYNKYINNIKEEFMSKAGYSDTETIDLKSANGILVDIDRQNYSISLAKPYSDSQERSVKKIHLSEEQFKKIDTQIELGKFIYIGRTNNIESNTPERGKVTYNWSIKQLNINQSSRSQSFDILKQMINLKNEVMMENNNNIPLDSANKIRIGKVKEITHIADTGAYSIKLEMINSDKTLDLNIDQESAGNFLESNVIQLDKYIFAMPVSERVLSDTKKVNEVTVVTKDYNIEKDVNFEYESILSKSKLTLQEHEIER